MRTYPLLLVLLLLPSAALTAELRPRVASRLSVLGEPQSFPLAAGETFELDSKKAYLLEADDRMPVMLIPSSSSETIEAEGPRLSQALAPTVTTAVNQEFVKLFPRVSKIQSLLQQRRLKEAEAQINALESDRPDFRFVMFFRASLLLLQGNRVAARDLARQGVSQFPDYEDGKVFLKNLEGGTR